LQLAVYFDESLVKERSVYLLKFYLNWLRFNDFIT